MIPSVTISTSQASSLRQVSKELEASFLSEMLKHSGLGENDGSGEFGSFLRDAQAKEIVKSGGIGLSELILKSLERQIDED